MDGWGWVVISVGRIDDRSMPTEERIQNETRSGMPNRERDREAEGLTCCRLVKFDKPKTSSRNKAPSYSIQSQGETRP